MAKKEKYILGIETTCDETGLAIVSKQENRKPKLITNLVHSQIAIHQKTKGIVPEVAAREQVNKIFPLLNKLNQEFPIKKTDAIAVAYGPGLVGSLLVGINLAKTLSYLDQLPIIKINHVTAHLYGAIIDNNKEIKFPAIGLIVSGGHTQIVLMESHQKIKILGQTKDDAAGESFDKVAALLGLNYPGGPEIERFAKKPADINQFNLPRPLINDNSYDFSFSGLKTAVLSQTEKGLNKNEKRYLAYDFQLSVAQVIAKKLQKAVLDNNCRSIVVGGGVIANSALREEILNKNLPNLILPDLKYTSDNGANIATRASYLFEAKQLTDWRKLEVSPNLKV